MSEPVPLTETEIRVATMVGAARHRMAMDLDMRPVASAPQETSEAVHPLGAAGELLVAKILGRYPRATMADGPDYAGDVPPDIEVRTTAWLDGCLIVRPRDHRTRPYVLVCGRPPDLVVAGWITGAAAMHPRYLRTTNDGRPPAYFVPASALRSIDELRGWR